MLTAWPKVMNENLQGAWHSGEDNLASLERINAEILSHPVHKSCALQLVKLHAEGLHECLGLLVALHVHVQGRSPLTVHKSQNLILHVNELAVCLKEAIHASSNIDGTFVESALAQLYMGIPGLTLVSLAISARSQPRSQRSITVINHRVRG